MRRHLDEGLEGAEQPAAAAGEGDARTLSAGCQRAHTHCHSFAPQINKCLKALEHRKLVKAVKSVANGNRKVYMLFELEPSREITGGAWCV